MSIGWIKFRKSLLTDGRVRMAARTCGEKKATIIGGLAMLWMIADDQATDDGSLVGYVADDIDDEIGVPGFCESLPEDWIDLSGEFVRLPNYLEHNGDTAKKRSQSATRKRKQRTYDEKCHAMSVTQNANHVTHKVGQERDQIREDKSREDKTRQEEKKSPPNPPEGEGADVAIPASLDTEEFREAWKDWNTYRAERKKKLTPSTVEHQFRQMEKWGPAVSAEAIRTSIQNGWTGLFEPKDRGSPGVTAKNDMAVFERFMERHANDTG